MAAPAIASTAMSSGEDALFEQAAIKAAKLFSPAHVMAIDLASTRLEAAKRFGADIVVKSDPAAVDDVIADVTGGLGVDVAIEAVGIPETFELCTQLVRPGGHVANIGVHGKPATLHLESLWIKNVTITTGLVDTYSTPTLLKMLEGGQLTTHEFVTHRFILEGMLAAYDTFADAAESGALKVVIERT